MEARLPDPQGLLGGSPYADPREIEHPLTPLDRLDVQTLAWVQPLMMHPAYELWAEEWVVATIRFRNLQRREALAASAQGVWTLSEGMGKTDIFTMKSGAEVDAVFRRRPHNDGAVLVREDRALAWQRLSVWNRVFAFSDEYGAEKMKFEVDQEDSGRTIVTIPHTTRFDPDASILAIAGQYLILSHLQPVSSKRSSTYST